MTLAIMEKTCKLTFAIAMVWTYLNLVEFSSVWYGHNMYDKEVLIAKAVGPYAWIFWTMIFCGSVVPFALAFQKLRRHMPTMFVVSLLLNLSMYFERWMIVAPTLSLSHQPHQWFVMYASPVQWAIVFGSFGWFSLLFLVFVKVFPSVSMYEVKEMVYHRRRHGGHAHAPHAAPATKPGFEGGRP
jgi:molybdopterin-containing oxidoreductase family membrane subunit